MHGVLFLITIFGCPPKELQKHFMQRTVVVFQMGYNASHQDMERYYTCEAPRL